MGKWANAKKAFGALWQLYCSECNDGVLEDLEFENGVHFYQAPRPVDSASTLIPEFENGVPVSQVARPVYSTNTLVSATIPTTQPLPAKMSLPKRIIKETERLVNEP